LECISKVLGIRPTFKEANQELQDDDDSSTSSSSSSLSMEFLPSVDFGPVDITKALTTLSWKPTPMMDAVRDTTNFCERAWFDFPEERPLDDFTEDMILYLNTIYDRKAK
jgi:hypothetical protein